MKTKIMVFGTFDGVHKGHFHFFEQAKKLAENPYLIVSVARDLNVKKIKGEKPGFKERKRMALIKEKRIADKVILAGKEKYLPHILRENPEIIALGYDQKAYVKELKKDLKKLGFPIKIIRLKPYKAHIYKNHLLKKSRV